MVAIATLLIVLAASPGYSEGNEKPVIQIRAVTIMAHESPIWTDITTGMPAYCLDKNRDSPDPNSLGASFDPQAIYGDAYPGLRALLLAGYPYDTGGLSPDVAQGYTQYAVWCWTYETMGYGQKYDEWFPHAPPGREADFFESLMTAARAQTLSTELSAPDILMVQDGDSFIGTTTVSYRNLQGGYTIDAGKLPSGISYSGYTGGAGDVLTFTAPLAFAGQVHALDEALLGYDTRSPLNLFWYDNKINTQQRMTISMNDRIEIAVSAGFRLEFAALLPEPPGMPQPTPSPTPPPDITVTNPPTPSPTPPPGITVTSLPPPTEFPSPTRTPSATELPIPTAPTPTDPIDPVHPPQPTMPGHRMVPQDDGTYMEIDENGIPIGLWMLNEDGEWIPLGVIPQTGADDTSLFWLLGLCASLAMIVLVLYEGRRKKTV